MKNSLFFIDLFLVLFWQNVLLKDQVMYHANFCSLTGFIENLRTSNTGIQNLTFKVQKPRSYVIKKTLNFLVMYLWLEIRSFFNSTTTEMWEISSHMGNRDLTRFQEIMSKCHFIDSEMKFASITCIIFYNL